MKTRTTRDSPSSIEFIRVVNKEDILHVDEGNASTDSHQHPNLENEIIISNLNLTDRHLAE